MSSFAEYTNNKKKKKDIENISFKDYTSSVLGISFADIAPIGKDKEERREEDIAPVKGGGSTRRESGTTTLSENNAKERTWFQKGEFEDGYQFGDVSKTILGSKTDVITNVGAGIIGMGEKVADALMYLAPSAYQSSMVQAGQSFDIKTYREMQKESAEFIQKDLYDEQKIAKNIISEPVKKITGVDSETASVFGAKSDALAQSAGQLGATIGLNALGLPWWATTGVTSFGGEAESALTEGATFDQAGASALITAGADILTEKISGGIKFGGKTLDDGLTKALARNISDKTLRTLTKLGVDATGEGVEEVLSGVISNLGTSLYKEENIEELLFSEEALDEYIESFVGGAVLGGGMGGINAVRSNSKGVDYATGMTENEQKVHDAEVKRRTEEAEKEAKEKGEKLTNKEKKAIYEQVTEDLERGHIDTSNIESVLGGETYERYNSIVEQEKAINEEIEALENKVENTFTHKDSERLAELRKQLETIDKQSVQERLSAEVEEMTRADRLHESYNERSRKGQAFEADLTKYEGIQQETVKRAIESGILNNTNRTHEFVDLVAKLSADKGVLFDFTDNAKLKETGFALEGRTVNGYVQDGKIAVNINSSKALNTVVGHEITHVLEGTELYTELQNAVTQYAKTKGEYDSRLEALTKLYEGVENANIENELTADLVGEYIFTDKNFINNLSTEKPSLFQKIFDEVKYLVKVATAGSKEARELAKVKRLFEQAYKETSKAKPKDSFDIEFTAKENTDISFDTLVAKPNMKVSEITTELSEIENKSTHQLAKEARERLVEKGFQGNDGAVRVHIDDTGTDVIVGLPGLRHGLDRNYEYTALVSMHLDSYLKNAIKINEALPDVNREHGSDIYLGYGETVNGEKVPAYFVVSKLTTGKTELVEFGSLYSVRAKKIAEDSTQGSPSFQSRTSAEISVSDLLDIVNDIYSDVLPKTVAEHYGHDRRKTKLGESVVYSLSEDSEGNSLSPAVKKRFEKSKAVDENGNLKLLYHGTPSGEFTIFDKSKGSVEGDFGSGFYFTDNEADVEHNYEGGGPDFENKVARRAEQIEAEEEIDYDEAEQMAREELYKGSYKFRVYLNVENPAVVGETILLDQESLDPGYDPDDFDSEDEYYEQIEQDISERIEELVWEVEKNVDVYSTDGLAEVLFEAYYEGGIGIEELKAKINELYLEDNEGNMVGNEVTRQIIESLGYDGIIDSTVSSKFRNMGMEEGTTHYIVFKPNQIKSFDNQNPTDNPDINLSLSSNNQDIAPTGNYRVYGSEVALEAPVTETQVAEDYAPLTEEMANERDAQQGDRLYSLDDTDAPQEVEEAPYFESEPVEAENPFEERDIQEVGKRDVKAYMYENPEVRPYFQEEAKIMLRELRDSIKGEKHFNDQLYYDTNGELGWFGTKRETSEQIAYLLDRFKYTYADIRKGLEAIIEDHGAENIAVAKRLEFMIDERLRDGYTDFTSGYDIPANQEYLTLMQEKQISDYSDEAFEMWARSLSDEHAPAEVTEEIAPVREEVVTTNEKQQVMDFEKGEIVDEEEPEARKTHGEIQKGYVDAIKAKFAKAGYDFDKVLENAKNKSTFASVDNTPQRFIEKTLGYKEGQLLNDMTIEQEALNESAGIKWLNSFTSRKDGKLAQLSKKYGIKPNSKADASAQMYGEGFYVNEAGEYITYGDAELAKDFPDVEMQKKIKALAKDPLVRQIYDETLTQINASRVRNGYPEIPRRKDYFLHFRAMDDTFSRLGIPFNPNSIQTNDLPTDINGMTADLKPGQPYFASAMQRRGNKTSYSLLGGMEKYLTSAKNQIYHIDDIQTLRGLRNYIADMYGQAHGLENLNELTEEEAEARIKEVYGAHLSNFAKFLNEQANTLAGKTSLVDRGLEGLFGRRGISTLNTINTQVAKNMVGFNISSSLTNFVGAVQGLAKVNKFDAIKAFSQVAYNKMTGIFGKTDGFAENDPGIIRRKGAEKFYRTPYEKVSDAGYVLMSAVDDVTSEFLIRAKYNELTRKGMNSEKAHIEADKWAMRILGDRSLGQQPQLYNSKMLGLFTKFQLEVRNQLDSMFYDTIQEANVSTEDIQNGLERNAKKSAKIASTMVQLAVFQHLFGKGFEAVAGYNPAFDIISVLMTLVGYDDDEESEDTALDNVEQAFLELLGDLPYTSTLTGGRIPIESALPIEQFVTGKDSYGNEKSRWETFSETIPYYIMPGGYNQIKKTKAGLEMFNEELPVTGSYTDSGNLRFPVEDTPLNRIQAGVFGQWASKNARDYFDNERKPLKEKQIEEYAELDLPIAEYWKYREGLAKQDTLEDKFDYIAGLDLPVEKKNIMINNVVDRKEEVDLTNYDDFEDYEEFDFAVKNPEKYPVVKAVGGYDSYKKYTSALSDITADKDENGKTINGSRKEKVTNYIDRLNADYGTKIILFKSEYPADNTYNQDIVDYLNEREDITYSDMESILKALGFTVEADGTVRW